MSLKSCIGLNTTELYTRNVCRAANTVPYSNLVWKLILWTEFSTAFNPTSSLLDSMRPA